jgi:hypothetical protein
MKDEGTLRFQTRVQGFYLISGVPDIEPYYFGTSIVAVEREEKSRERCNIKLIVFLLSLIIKFARSLAHIPYLGLHHYHLSNP